MTSQRYESIEGERNTIDKTRGDARDGRTRPDRRDTLTDDDQPLITSADHSEHTPRRPTDLATHSPQTYRSRNTLTADLQISQHTHRRPTYLATHSPQTYRSRNTLTADLQISQHTHRRPTDLATHSPQTYISRNTLPADLHISQHTHRRPTDLATHSPQTYTDLATHSPQTYISRNTLPAKTPTEESRILTSIIGTLTQPFRGGRRAGFCGTSIFYYNHACMHLNTNYFDPHHVYTSL